MPPLFALIVVVLFLPAEKTAAQDRPEKKSAEAKLSADDEAFLRICDRWRQGAGEWMQENQEVTEHDKRFTSYEVKLKTIGVVADLIAFEQSHRGTSVGLMAARRLWMLQLDGVRNKGVLFDGGKYALDSLGHYGEHDELVELLRFVDLGRHPSIEPALRKFIAQPMGIKDTNRDWAKFTLARWMLQQQTTREAVEEWLKQVDAKELLPEPGEREAHEEILSLLVPSGRLADLRTEARAIAQSLIESKSTAQQFAVNGVDPHQFLISVDREKTSKGVPDLTSMAAGLLFKDTHLQVGKPAPELNVKLIGGAEFSLADQRGKVVIVTFGYNGCAPCEAMYGEFRELTQKYGDGLSIMMIMRDPSDYEAKRHLANGNITWKVTLDVFPGPLTMGWGVRGFPATYVYDREGKLAGDGLRGLALKEKVKELVASK